MYTVRVSVRGLISFVLQTGDIDSGFVGSSRLAEGIWHHQTIQRENRFASNPENRYTSEVPVLYTVKRGGITLEVGGRIDGIFENADGVTIQEIKSTSEALESLSEDSNPLYWAQGKCYAFMYAKEHKLKSVTVQLLYSQLDTRNTRIFEESFSIKELEKFFERLVREYIAWAKELKLWARTRDSSMGDLSFPFDTFRAGQKELVDTAWLTIKRGAMLFAQAPTGIGKTMATLYPAVKSVGDGVISKIFYATAKNSTRAIAENALETLRRRGLRLKTSTLTAKDKICFNPDAECTPEECVFAKGYYDRLRPAVKELFEQDTFDRPAIESLARKHSLCPFEFSLDMSLWADCIICDYNYLFDPRVYLRRFFADEDRSGAQDYLFLIDEAHNLVDRARDMFSAELSYKMIKDVQAAVAKPSYGKDAARLLKLGAVISGLCEFMEKALSSCKDGGGDEGAVPGFVVKTEVPEEILPELKALISAAEKILETGKPYPFSDKLLELYFEAHNFLRTAEYFDKRYRCYYEQNEEEVKIKLFCVDPSHLLKEALERARSAVFFSATLTPLAYFQKLLGGDDSSEVLKLGSPFPSENLCVLVDDKISTTFRMREFSYDRISKAIASIAGGKVGNYMVYFPSYKYMNEVSRRFIHSNPSIKVLCQGPGMNDAQRWRFLEEFSGFGEKTLVGFAVMGGIFGEGIDLVGERLSGAVIVGVGLPQISLERNIIRLYFQETMEAGYEYAYIYPGMNKVLQASGRVIRTETDRGVILLMDERFSREPYSALIPEYWHPLHHLKAKSIEHAKELLTEFWK
jgi:DNA excision repair protein ERCC-2